MMLKTFVGDLAIAAAAIIAIPIAILVVGTPVVLFARLLIAIAERLS